MMGICVFQLQALKVPRVLVVVFSHSGSGLHLNLKARK